MFHEYMLMYFTNHDGNQFLETFFNILPRCALIKEKNYKIAISILERKIVRLRVNKIRYHGNLGGLYNKLSQSPENFHKGLE